MNSQLLNKVSMRLIPFMLVLYVISYLDRINVSFAGLQMTDALKFDASVFGLGSGIFFAGYSLFAIPSNLVIEKLGARKWIACIMIVWGMITILMPMVRTPIEFYILRFVLGVAEAGFFPGMILYLTYWFPKREQGTAVSRFMTAIPVAGVLGGFVASVVLGTSFMHLAGWQLLFITTGIPAILLGPCVYFYLTDSPSKADWLTESEHEALSSELAAERAGSNSGQSMRIAEVFVNPSVWLLAAIYFGLNLSMYGFQLWLPQIIKACGSQSDSSTALLSAIPAVAQALGMILIARSSDRRGERRWHLVAACMFGVVCLIIAGMFHTLVLTLAALRVAAFCIWGSVGPFWALKAEFLSPATAAAGIGLINSVGTFGGFFGPYLVGLLKNYTSDFGASLFFIASILFIAGCLALAVPKPVRDRV